MKNCHFWYIYRALVGTLSDCDSTTQFKCEITGRCIPKKFLCDGSRDCGTCDDSDERQNCPTLRTTTVMATPGISNFTCGAGQFQCAASGRCIPLSYQCDRDFDCRLGD